MLKKFQDFLELQKWADPNWTEKQALSCTRSFTKITLSLWSPKGHSTADLTGDTWKTEERKKRKTKHTHSAVTPNTKVILCFKAPYTVVYTSVTLSILCSTVSIALFIVLAVIKVIKLVLRFLRLLRKIYCIIYTWAYLWGRFEPRSHFISRMSMIVQVEVVFTKKVV